MAGLVLLGGGRIREFSEGGVGEASYSAFELAFCVAVYLHCISRSLSLLSISWGGFLEGESR